MGRVKTYRGKPELNRIWGGVRMKKNTYLRFLLCVLAVFTALLAGACGGKDEEAPEEDPAEAGLNEDGQEAEPQEEERQTPVDSARMLARELWNLAGRPEELKDLLRTPVDEPAPSGDPAAQAEPADAEAAAGGEPDEDKEEEKLAISLAEAINYVENLDPAQLGLDGEDMDEYEVLPNQFIVPVDGLLCSELMIYSRNGKTGTNELVEKILISRGPERQIYRLDPDTAQVVLLMSDQNRASDALASQTQGDPSAKAGEESG